MLVKEAKKKMCPFVGIPNDVTIPNRKYVNVNCICGDCMAWKYTKIHSDTKREPYVLTENGYSKKLYRDVELSEEEKEGYCVRIGNGIRT